MLDLTPPPGLVRQRTPETKAAADAIINQTSGNRPREWAPIKKKGEWAERPTMPNFASDPALPVRVQVKKSGQAGSTLLAEYPSFAAFEAGHDGKTYPVKGSSVLDGHTVVLVTAKPWAGKIAAVPGIDEPSPPTKRQVRRERAGNVEEAILKTVPAQGANRNTIQGLLVASGMDKTMLDNSLGGRLDRLARDGKLVKTKDGKKVTYALPGAVPAKKPNPLLERILNTFKNPVVSPAPAPAPAAKKVAKKKAAKKAR
jgi:hypothetical protein